jgi:hypothetical protein
MDPHDLYGLPLERFVPERDDMTKALRQGGEREKAREVAALRKPSVAAWAVNQLIRTQTQPVAALFRAGDALQQTQANVLAGRGGGGDALREALTEERRAVEELVAKATGLLTSQGHELTPTTLERVSETLHAAALDSEARAQLEAGCLHRELRHVGLGAGGALGGPSPARPARPARKPARGTDREAPKRTTTTGPDQAGGEQEPAEGKGAGREHAGREHAGRERAERERAERERAKRDRAERSRAARKDEANARRAAERATAELRRAERARDRAAEGLQDAESAVDVARERAVQAASSHQQAQKALEGL